MNNLDEIWFDEFAEITESAFKEVGKSAIVFGSGAMVVCERGAEFISYESFFIDPIKEDKQKEMKPMIIEPIMECMDMAMDFQEEPDYHPPIFIQGPIENLKSFVHRKINQPVSRQGFKRGQRR